MKLCRNSKYFWAVVIGLGFGFLLRILLHENYLDIVIGISGIGLSVAIVIIWTQLFKPNLLWNESHGCLAINGKYKVEVLAGCTLTSVPLGIDLSHSARKVLRALSSRLGDSSNCEVRFFVVRPNHGTETRVGLIISQTSLRLINGINRASSLLDKMNQHIMTMESALRAAYPHTPVERATVEDLILATNGGVLTHEV